MGRAYRSRRVLPFLGGFLLGVLGLLLGLLVLIEAAPDLMVRDVSVEGLVLPPAAYQPEVVEIGQPLRVAATDFAILDPRGGDVLRAPEAEFSFDPAGIGAAEPMTLYDMAVRSPTFRIVQYPDGTINLMEAFATDEPRELREQPALVLAGLRITGGRGTVSVGSGFPLPDGPQTFPMREIRSLEGQVAEAAFGGPGGWAIDITSLQADVPDPGYRIRALAGRFGGVEPEGIRFDLRRFETDASRLAGEGVIAFGPAGLRADAQIRAERLDFADVRHFFQPIPAEGWAQFVLDLEPRPGARTAIALRDATVRANGSLVSGRLAAVVGGDLPPVFFDTRLELDPLDLAILERMGLVDEPLPYTGAVRGTLASIEAMEGFREGALWVNVVADVRARGRTAGSPSSISAAGALAFDLDAPWVRFDGLRVEGQPLHLADLQPLVDVEPELLRGTLRGGARLAGTPSDLRFDDGALMYDVPDGPPTTLVGLSGQLQTAPVLSYRIDARAEPLALGTLTALFPQLPFRVATLEGPISLRGTADRLSFEADLVGEAGGLDVGGVLAFGDPLTFDVSGEVIAFRAALLLQPDVPVRGPLTGTFAARGSTRDLRFDVDLMQMEGTIALGGRIRSLPEGFYVDVAGTLDEFPLGSVVGRPGLFPAPLTGTLAVEGTPARYDFDVDLVGDPGQVRLAGFYESATIPRYAFAGRVAGLDLSRLPVELDLPRSRITADVEIDAEGVTPETFAGRVRLVSDGSTVGGFPVDRAVIDLLADRGILQIDALDLAYRGTRLTASGALGLDRPAPEALQFTFDSPDIGVLRPFLADPANGFVQLAGQLRAEGWLMGTLDRPTVGLAASGRQLRFQDWRAASLSTTLTAARLPAGWSGQATVVARDAAIPTGDRFETVRVEGVAEPGTASFAAFAARPNDAGDLAVTATLDMTNGRPVALVLQSLEANFAEARWQLVSPTRIAWEDVDGILIDDLQLMRVGHGDGFIRIDGRLPAVGDLALTVRIDQVNLAELAEMIPAMPPVRGILSLDVDVSGPAADPVMELRGEIEGAEVEGMGVDRIAIEGSYGDDRLGLDLGFWLGPQQVGRLDGTVPISVSFAGIAPSVELLDDAPLTVQLVADSLPLGFIAATSPGIRDGEGAIAADVGVGGTLANPTANGWLAVRQGALRVEALETRFHGINGNIQLRGDEIAIDSLVVRGGTGVARFDGFVRFDDWEQPRIALTTAMREFLVIDRGEVARMAISGDLALTGRVPEPVLRGRIVLDDGTITAPPIGGRPGPVDLADLDVGEIGGDTIPAGLADGAIPLLGNLIVDGVEVEIGDRVWLVSEQIRVQMAGAVTVFHAREGTRVAGELRAERGSYLLSIGPIVREFDIVQGSAQFFGTPDINPALDITAANEVRTVASAGGGSILTILVNVGGTLQRPTIELTSDTRPPLPESELLSFLVFGRPSFQLGEGTGQLAQQILLQEAIGGFFATQIEQILLRDIGLPLDYVRVRARPTEFTNPLGLTAIEAGVQIGRDIFWTVETGVPGIFGGVGGAMGPSWGTHLEWQIDREWSWRLSYEPIRRDPILQRVTLGDLSHQFSTDLRRRWEYGHPTEDVPMPDLRQQTPLPADPAVERIDPEAVPLEVPEEEPPPSDGDDDDPAGIDG